MVVISDIIVQGVQMLLVLLLAPLLTGFVRKIKARLVRRQGASMFQPYRDLLRLLRKEVVLADNASWLFRVIPYVTFAAIWVAAALVPIFATGLLFNWTADLIAIVALVEARASFWRSREWTLAPVLAASAPAAKSRSRRLRNCATLLIVFCDGAGSRLDATFDDRNFLASSYVGLRVSLGMALIALVMVALAENARIPVDNLVTHSDSPWCMRRWFEYSGRRSGDDGIRRVSRSPARHLADRLRVRLGRSPSYGPLAYAFGAGAYVVKLALPASARVVETATAKMKVFRIPHLLGAALTLGLLGTLLPFVSRSF